MIKAPKQMLAVLFCIREGYRIHALLLKSFGHNFSIHLGAS